jgi:acetyl esterase
VPLDPATQTIVDQMAAAGPVDFSALTPDAFRRLFRASLGALDSAGSADPEEEVEDRSIPTPAGPLRLRLYRPPTAGPAPLVTYFHGGGWVIGDVDTHDGSCRILSRRTGAVVVSVDYRLAPEHRFPAALDDCDAAVAWVAAHATELGGDPRRLGVAGDSAGGNLAAAVTQRARRRGGPAIAAQALVYPAVDFTPDRPSMRGVAMVPGQLNRSWMSSAVMAPDVKSPASMTLAKRAAFLALRAMTFSSRVSLATRR